MVLIGRDQARRNRPHPALCSRTSTSFFGNASTVSRMKNAEMPEQDNYQQNCSTDFKTITTDSSKWIIYLFLFTFSKNYNSTCLFQHMLTYPEPFSRSGFHSDLPLTLAPAMRHLLFLHVSIQIVSFVGEPRDCQSLQQIKGELIAVYTE